MTPDPREPKLPKWAQETLSELRRTIGVQASELTTLGGKVPESRILVNPYARAPERSFYLPNFETIKFDTGEQRGFGWINVHLREERGKFALEISTSGTLIVRPRVSNVVWITNEPH